MTDWNLYDDISFSDVRNLAVDRAPTLQPHQRNGLIVECIYVAIGTLSDRGDILHKLDNK